MRAAHITALGTAEVITVGDLPDPAPGPGEVLVRVHATSVNAVDTFVRSGAYQTPTPFPFVVGRDLVGTVERVGDGVTGFRPGEAVWCNSLGHGGRQGAAAELAVTGADRLYHLPGNLDVTRDAAATVVTLHPAATAHLALFTHGHGRPGQTVLVAGGAGHVGSMAVAMAARAGLRVVTTSSARDLDRCRELGASATLDYRSQTLADELRTAAPDGIDIWLDTAGHNDLALAVDLLATRGRIVAISGMASAPVLPVGRLYTRDGSVVGFAISNATVDELADAAGHVNEMLASGALPALPVREMPLDRSAEAHAAVEAGTGKDRIALVP